MDLDAVGLARMEDAGVLLKGFMRKNTKGTSLHKTTRRFFVLRKDANLYFYLDESEGDSKGRINLMKAHSISLDDTLVHVFSPEREWILQPDDGRTAKEWSDAMKTAKELRKVALARRRESCLPASSGVSDSDSFVGPITPRSMSLATPPPKTLGSSFAVPAPPGDNLVAFPAPSAPSTPRGGAASAGGGGSGAGSGVSEGEGEGEGEGPSGGSGGASDEPSVRLNAATDFPDLTDNAPVRAWGDSSVQGDAPLVFDAFAKSVLFKGHGRVVCAPQRVGTVVLAVYVGRASVAGDAVLAIRARTGAMVLRVGANGGWDVAGRGGDGVAAAQGAVFSVDGRVGSTDRGAHVVQVVAFALPPGRAVDGEVWVGGGKDGRGFVGAVNELRVFPNVLDGEQLREVAVGMVETWGGDSVVVPKRAVEDLKLVAPPAPETPRASAALPVRQRRPSHKLQALAAKAVRDVSVTDVTCCVGVPYAWQSFKAAQSGQLVQVTLQYSNTNSPTRLLLFEGEGTTGHLIANCVMPTSGSHIAPTDVFVHDMPTLVKGRQYTLQLHGHGYQVSGSTGGVYGEGSAGKQELDHAMKPGDDVRLNGLDLFFITHVVA